MSELNVTREFTPMLNEMPSSLTRPVIEDGYTYQSESGCEVTLRFRSEETDGLVERVLNMMRFRSDKVP